MKKRSIILLIQTLLGLISAQPLFRPLDVDTVLVQNVGKVQEHLYEGYGDYDYIYQSIVTINDQGDFAAIFSDDDSDYNARIAFINFDGTITNKYILAVENTGYEYLGSYGVVLLPSGENDSVIVIFTVQNSVSGGKGGNILMGILGKDGQWRRGQPIEVFYDKQFDNPYVEGDLHKYNSPRAAISGNFVVITCRAEIIDSSNGIDDYFIVYNYVDISGTDNLSVDDNYGTKIVIGGEYSDVNINQKRNDCLDLNGQGKIVCTVNTRKDITETFLMEFNNGQYVQSHVINYESEEFKTDSMPYINAVQLDKLPESDNFVVVITENQNKNKLVLLKYDITDLDNYTEINVTEPFKSFWGEVDYPTIEIVSQNQGYLILCDSDEEQCYLQEFNPNTLLLVGTEPIFLGYRTDLSHHIQMTTLVKDKSYKLAMLTADVDSYANEVNILDLKNQENCITLNTNRWYCLECEEGYQLTHEFYCVQGQGYAKIMESKIQNQAYQIPAIKNLEVGDQFSNIIQFTLVPIIFTLILA